MASEDRLKGRRVANGFRLATSTRRSSLLRLKAPPLFDSGTFGGGEVGVNRCFLCIVGIIVQEGANLLLWKMRIRQEDKDKEGKEEKRRRREGRRWTRSQQQRVFANGVEPLQLKEDASNKISVEVEAKSPGQRAEGSSKENTSMTSFGRIQDREVLLINHF